MLDWTSNSDSINTINLQMILMMINNINNNNK